MSLRPEKSSFTPEQIAEFQYGQALRARMLGSFGAALGVWRHCDQKPCRRNQSCARSDNACLYDFMARLHPRDKQLLRYGVEFAGNGLSAEAADAAAQEKLAAQERAMGEESRSAGSAGDDPYPAGAERERPAGSRPRIAALSSR